jgi:hypothetical protein
LAVASEPPQGPSLSATSPAELLCTPVEGPAAVGNPLAAKEVCMGGHADMDGSANDGAHGADPMRMDAIMAGTAALRRLLPATPAPACTQVTWESQQPHSAPMEAATGGSVVMGRPPLFRDRASERAHAAAMRRATASSAA